MKNWLTIKDFKKLGFSLAEIKGLLQADRDLGSEKLQTAMKARLMLITDQVDQLSQQRRAIMSFYGKVSVVVTGCDGWVIWQIIGIYRILNGAANLRGFELRA